MDVNAILAGMKKLERYFQRGTHEDVLFVPELEAAQRINNLLQQEGVSGKVVEEVIAIYNELENKPHLDGTGWLEFKMHIGWLAKAASLNVEYTGRGEIRLLD